VFDLKPGEVSPVLESGAAFCRIEARFQGTHAAGRRPPEIEAAVHSDRMQLTPRNSADGSARSSILKYLNLPSQPRCSDRRGVGRT